jgi:hypothetical protein
MLVFFGNVRCASRPRTHVPQVDAFDAYAQAITEFLPR